MVERDGDVADPPGDELALPHDGALGDPVDAEDADLGVVDQRRHQQAAELPGARDAEGRAAELLELQRAGACPVGKALQLRVELLEAGFGAVPNDRDDEALVRLDGNAEVAAVKVDDLVPLEPRVQLGKLLQRARCGAEDERDQQFRVDVREVALLDPRDGRDLAVRARQVLGDASAHAADRLAAAFGWGRARRCSAGHAADVLLGDPALRTGAGQRVEIDAELIRDPSDDGRRTDLAAARRERLRSRADALRWGSGDAVGAVAADHDEHRADGDDLALGDEDPRDLAGSG